LAFFYVWQEAYAEAEADLLASGKAKGANKRRKSEAAGGAGAAGGDAGDEEDAFFTGLALQDKLPKFVELLKFKVGWRCVCAGLRRFARRSLVN
jgi:hypothetical protein